MRFKKLVPSSKARAGAPNASPKSSLLEMPPELQLTIVEMLVQRYETTMINNDEDQLGDVLNLSLTCKALNEACEPVLFQRVILLRSGSCLGFLQALIRRPKVARFVKDVHMPQATKALIQTDTAWIQKATSIVEAEPIARELLKTGTIKVELLVLTRILQCLPHLRELCVSEIVLLSLARHWPAEQRLAGSAILALHLQICDSLIFGANRQCAHLGTFLESFQPGTIPKDAQILYLTHACLSHHHEDENDQWSEFARRLMFLHIQSNRAYPSSGILMATPALEHLSLIESITMVQVMQALKASPPLAESLRELHMVFPWREDEQEGRTLDDVLAPLTGLTNLRLLRVQIPSGTTQRTTLTKFPPSLAELLISWPRADHDLYGSQHFLIVLAQAVKECKTPASLQRVKLEWYDSRALLDERIETQDMPGLMRRIALLKEACNAKGIEMAHVRQPDLEEDEGAEDVVEDGQSDDDEGWEDQ